jgi:oligosaccharide repeat unit polymerase
MNWNMLLALDMLGLSYFGFSYYFKCYRKGYRIDFWHFQLFMLCVLPNLIMLPFAGSDLNRIVVGNDLRAVQAVLPTVFIITFVGYLSMLAGGVLWSLHLGLGIRKEAARIINVVPGFSLMMMSSRGLLMFHTSICLLFQIAMLGIYYSQNGFGFDLRSFTFANPALRPVALVISNYSIVVASHCLARYIDTREKILLWCTILLSFGLLFFGSRGNLVAIYLSILVCYLIKLRRRITLLRICLLAAFITVAGFYLGSVRAGSFSVNALFASVVFQLFYGNNFSDLRDFAWVYQAWDHVFWMGKTYLAGLLAFMPRVVSDFRDTWGAGVAMDNTVGLDPTVHPGLRPGEFGEPYFNFGIFGVIAAGLILGIIARRVDIDTRDALKGRSPSMRRAFASTILLGVFNFVAISVSSSGILVMMGIYLFSWACMPVARVLSGASFVGGRRSGLSDLPG